MMHGAVSGVSHYGIQVADLERSVAFYERLLGVPPLSRWVKDSPAVQALVAYPGLEVHGAVFRIPEGGGFLEILDYRNVDRTAVDPATANPGTAHICLYVDDLDALYQRLREDGVEFLSEPMTPESGPHAGGRVVYMVDPDGIRVELLQAERNLADEPRSRPDVTTNTTIGGRQ